MAIESRRVVIPGNEIATLVYSSSGLSKVLFNVSGGGILVGGPTVNATNGFRPPSEILAPLELKNGDEIWAIATSVTVVSMIIQT